MKLNDCKVCSNHICVLKNSILCGFKIDRAELPIVTDEDNEQIIPDCPKEQGV